MRVMQGHRDHHALAGSQTIGLHHNRNAFFIHVGTRCCCIVENLELGGWYVVPLHEIFGKSLGAFELSRRLGGSEHPQAVIAKFINNASRQGLLRSHHSNCYFFSSSPYPKGFRINDIDVYKSRVKGGSAVSRRDIHRLHLGRLSQFPGQSMFSATAAHH